MNLHILKFHIVLIIWVSFVSLQSCGKAYFPIELKTETRAKRNVSQSNTLVNLVPITPDNIKVANRTVYPRKVIDATDRNKPAKILSLNEILVQKLPNENNPGPYLLGPGDKLQLSEYLNVQDEKNTFISRTVLVSHDGYISIFGLGRFSVAGMTSQQVEELLFERSLEGKKLREFEIQVVEYNSKKVYVEGIGINSQVLDYTNSALYLEDVLSVAYSSSQLVPDVIASIEREGDVFKSYVLNNYDDSGSFKIRIYPNDKIKLRPINYRKESVLIVGETGTQKSIQINHSTRPTLSDMLFSRNNLNLITTDFSQIYVIRETKSIHNAYHLDITDPVRISLAGKFEMRPDDIIFVATQPLSLYSRTLSQILGSTGLTLQARDSIRTELGN